MCNYCQTSSVFSHSCNNNTRWRVQRICYDSNGNVQVILSNGCVCRRLTCGAWQDNACASDTNTATTNGCGCATNVSSQNGCSCCAGLYGSYSYGNGRSCGCGCNSTL